MRIVTFAGPGCAIVEEVATPVCGPGQILCRALYSGVSNGTERSVLTGGAYGGRWPARIAYQSVARVLASESSLSSCPRPGEIIFCGTFGAHAEFFAAPVLPADAEDNLVVVLEEEPDLRQAALLGLASVALHSLARCRLTAGEEVLVVGAGPLGLLVAQAAHQVGGRVALCDLSHERLAVAQTWGAPRLQTIEDDDSWERLRQWAPFDAVIETSGAEVLGRLIGSGWGGGLLAPRGRLVLVGGRKAVSYDFLAAQARELEILHCDHFDRSDLLRACERWRSGDLQIPPLLREVLPVARAPEFYERLCDAPESTLGTVFDWTA